MAASHRGLAPAVPARATALVSAAKVSVESLSFQGIGAVTLPPVVSRHGQVSNDMSNTNIKYHPSPNWRERKGVSPRLLIVHYTAMDFQSALTRLCNPDTHVSSHYVIDEDGTTYRLVDEKHSAFHAGTSFWQGQHNINDSSIGIELVHDGHQKDGTIAAYADEQITALESLCLGIMARWHMRAGDVWGHSDVAPTRKQDPGESFPWQRLAAQGIGIFPPPNVPRQEIDEGAEEKAKNALRTIGYGVDVYPFIDVMTAFQRHFRPSHVSGELDSECLSLMTWLRGVL